MRGNVSPWNGQGGFGGADLHGSGPWQSATPGATSGFPMVLPAGTLRAWVGASCYSTNGAAIQMSVFVWFDGVFKGSMVLPTATATNQHHSLVPCSFTIPQIAAGTHYVCLQQNSGTSDGTDTMSFLGIVLPA